MKRAFVILIISFSLPFGVGWGEALFAQDIHFSQFNASPQNLNPSQTGLFDGDWRFVGNLRNQWSAVPVPYNTFSLSTDTRFKSIFNGDVPAIGLIANTDKSGDSRLSTTNFYISLSYIKKLDKDSTHFLSIGVQPGITNKSFNPNALTFDNQYDGDSYNPALPSGENFTNAHINYFDIGGGITYLYRESHRFYVSFGLAALHLTQPKQLFYAQTQDRLARKITFNGIANLPLAEKFDIVPTFLYSHQGTYNETVGGMYGKYYLTPVDGMPTAFALGMLKRYKDAFIFAGYIEYRNFNVGVSYDLNSSYLSAATNYRGGFEISVIYIFKKIIPFVAKKRVCPIYM